MAEMGYRVGRRHAGVLRAFTVAALFVLPSIALATGPVAGPPFTLWASAAAAISAGLGVIVERWLFFAEARHVSMLYYRG